MATQEYKDQLANIISAFFITDSMNSRKERAIAFYIKRPLNDLSDESIDVLLKIFNKLNIKIKEVPFATYDYLHRKFKSDDAYFTQKDATIYICLDFTSIPTLCHEIGHYLYFFFKNDVSLNNYKKNLLNIIKEEFNFEFSSKLHDLLAAFREKIESKHGVGSFKLIEENIMKHSDFITLNKERLVEEDIMGLGKKEKILEEQKKIFNELNEIGYVEDILEKYKMFDYFGKYDLPSSKCDIIFEDLMSSRFDSETILIPSTHNPFYYRYNEELIGEEFFCNAFRYLLIKGKANFTKDNPLLIKHFPKSLDAVMNINEYLIRKINEL